MKDKKIFAPEENMHVSVGHIKIDMKEFGAKPDTDSLPILPTRNLVLFPEVNMSVGLGRESSIAVALQGEQSHTPIGVVCQVNPDQDNPGLGDLFGYGVYADVLKVIELPDGQKTALLHARGRFRIEGPGEKAAGGVITAHVKSLREWGAPKNDPEFEACIIAIRSVTADIIHKSSEGAPLPFENDTPAAELVNTVATNMPIPNPEKIEMLATNKLKDRSMLLLTALQSNSERIDITRDILERTRHTMEGNQRNAFLQQQMDTIREELYGDESDDAEQFEALLAGIKGLNEQTTVALNKEIDKLRRLNPSSPDYSVQYSYLDTVLRLPWNKYSEENTDFSEAERILEKDHYGLEKVKERIIEQVALLMNNPDGKSPIICLVGPPGVGKTSLGASVARALGRMYQRVALGGLHDEAEIRGHRRTYIGAMPGRIIGAMKRAGTSNPVLLLDEIDKIGADYKGDPAAALLEVLDPEQNCRFHDNYVDLDFDLSKVLFIATANSLSTVSRPLLDRIEVIDIAGYLVEEKLEIAKRHLIPRLKRELNVKRRVAFSEEALRAIIENYTSESGVRQLEKQLAKILRKDVLADMRSKDFPGTLRAKHLQDILGLPPFRRDTLDDEPQPGVVTGLAWTQVGGEILLVEVSLSTAKNGGRLTLTGNLGDVMKESATIALEWVKAHGKELNIDAEAFEKNNVHVHFPEGAIPKDGPSAGVTMVTAIVSAFTGKAPRAGLAMTGEATLRGRVLPVGGIREKLLAARRAGVTDIVISEENRRDVEDIPAAYLQGVTMHYVRTLSDVLAFALS